VFPDEPTSNRAVLIKTALDQLVWGPVMLVVFVGEAAGLLRCLGARLPGTLSWGALPACLQGKASGGFMP
jgi:hypothetical protein